MPSDRLDEIGYPKGDAFDQEFLGDTGNGDFKKYAWDKLVRLSLTSHLLKKLITGEHFIEAVATELFNQGSSDFKRDDVF